MDHVDQEFTHILRKYYKIHEKELLYPQFFFHNFIFVFTGNFFSVILVKFNKKGKINTCKLFIFKDLNHTKELSRRRVTVDWVLKDEEHLLHSSTFNFTRIYVYMILKYFVENSS